MTKEELEKINKFTRRKFAEDELYTFSVILCDNDIDRDLESFSDKALDTLKECFVGKTGVFDHNASTVNQNARIYDTEVICDNSRKTKDCRPYRYLKANAYMVRTDENKNLIAEIDGGIKKEVSISCAAAKKICSVCGCDKNKDGCNHVKGRFYSDRLCHTILDKITDAYEWSFVAVPAQVNAGVTKRFTSDDVSTSSVTADIKAADNELRRDIRRLAFFAGGTAAAELASISAKNMTTQQLISYKKIFESRCKGGGIRIQLESPEKKPDNSDFSTR